jgi:hypothetical protein
VAFGGDTIRVDLQELQLNNPELVRVTMDLFSVLCLLVLVLGATLCGTLFLTSSVRFLRFAAAAGGSFLIALWVALAALGLASFQFAPPTSSHVSHVWMLLLLCAASLFVAVLTLCWRDLHQPGIRLGELKGDRRLPGKLFAALAVAALIGRLGASLEWSSWPVCALLAFYPAAMLMDRVDDILQRLDRSARAL